MANLLLFWLNHELRLSSAVTDLDADFASGYLLGEVLHRLNQQHNFADFMRSASADAKIVNFCLLEPTLRNLNVRFDANRAAAIMNEQRGAAADLLYQIKMAAARIQRAPAVSTRAFEETKVVPLHNRSVKLTKPVFDAGNHRFFELSIRHHVQSVAALKHQKDIAAQEVTRHQAYLAAKQQEKNLLEITKAERLHKAFIHSQFIKESLEETDSPAWRLALETKHAREQRRATFYRQLMAKHHKAQNDLTFSLRRTVQEDLDAFERQEADKARKAGRIPHRKSSGYGLRSLTTALGKSATEANDFIPTARSEDSVPTDNDMQRDAVTIKQQKLQREKRREALERRRKRFLQGCSASYTNFAGARATAVLETLALRSTNREREMQGEIERIRCCKEVARENRELRSLAYDQQREEDSFRRVDRDSNHYSLLIRRFDDDVRIQRVERRHLEGSIDVARHFSIEVFARDITIELVQFALFVAKKREETLFAREPSVFLDTETWMELRALFGEGKPLVSRPRHTNDDEDPTNETRLLDAREFDKYLQTFRPVRSAIDYVGSTAKGSNVSPWHPRDSRFVGAAEVLEECYVLGEEIKYLRWIDHTVLIQEDTSALVPEVSKNDLKAAEQQSLGGDETPSSVGSVDSFENELRILIFGPPFAGKATQAKLLASKYNLTLFSIHQLLQEAIASKSEFGLQLEQWLADGMAVTAEQYARLAVNAVQTQSRDIARFPTASSGDAAKTSGWIIYDLPSTEEQGLKLEEMLSGYVDPRAILSPFDLESPIAPGCPKPELPSSFFHGKSGVDLVFYLHCDEEVVMQRCLGQLADEATGTKWHLQLNAPPEGATFRHRLSHVNHSLNASELLSVHVLTTESNADAHNAWYSKFGTLREIVGESVAGTPDKTHQVIISHVEEFIQEQTHKNLVRQQDKEDGELLLMIGEASRQERIVALESSIAEAQEELARRQQTLQQAEEAKAKKEELTELRASVEAGRQRIDQCILDAKSWAMEEQMQMQASVNAFSGDLTLQTARVLAQMWNDMEAQYVSTMHYCFSRVRQQRAVLAERSQAMVIDFCTFIRRPDTKQVLVNQFQQRFNEVLDEMRFDDATKDELHARADILQDELCTVIASKIAGEEEELASLVSDGWTEDTCQSIALTYQTALQAECDRFRVSLQVLVEGYSAASRNRPALLHLVETTQNQIARLDFTCRVFGDPSGQSVDEIPPQPAAPTAPASSATKATSAKVKGKQPPAAASTVAKDAAPAAGDQIKEGNGDATSIEDMQIMYDTAVQKCEALFAAVIAAPNAAGTSKDPSPTAPGDGDHHEETDAAAINLRNGIKFEHEQMLQRVRFLREVATAACENVSRAVRAVEQSLRQVIDERKRSEEGAVASLVQHIREVIECESDLPCVINIAPPPVYRFPPTAHLPEDTLVTIESERRLIPLAPPEKPPIIEHAHDLLLNERQQQYLHSALGWNSRRLLPACQLVGIMEAAASLPDALPKTWQESSEVAFAEVASKCMRRRPGFVDVDVFVDTMINNEQELLRIVHEDQIRQEATSKAEAAAVGEPQDTEPAASTS